MAQQASWRGSPRIKGYSTSHRMAMLTFSLIGLQFTWGVEMTYFTPYLLQLGLAKSQTSLVWIAPPLSGLIVQPIIGTVSDSSKLRWGRRRPYMLVCSLLVAFFLLTLAWASEIVGVFIRDETLAKKATVALAIFCIYAVDFAINAVQATSRSLIVDTLPVSQQQLGSAWAGRMLGLGHILGYLAGTLDLMKIFGTALGTSQFKQVCVIASATMTFCITITCYSVEERVLLSESIDNARSVVLKMFATILKTALHLPRRIRAVCWITFWCWIGWSPFFVYGTTWVGETYYREDASRAEELRKSTDVVGDIARRGSLALVLFSFISFAGSILLPWIVESPADDDDDDTSTSSKRIPKSIAKTVGLLQRYRPDITTAWGLSQLGFGFTMILAPMARSFEFATTLIALCGIPWAMYGWAPLAIMGEEINKLENSTNSAAAYSRISQGGDVELTRHSADFNPALVPPDHFPTDDTEESFAAAGGTAGVYLGIWNIFATIPQFLATFISMIAFSILEPGKSPELSPGDRGTPTKVITQGLSGTAVCLAIGAVCSFVAAMHSFRLRKM